MTIHPLEIRSSFEHMVSYKGSGPIEVLSWNRKTLSKKDFYICQHKYALDILSDAGFSGTKPLTFPMELNHQHWKAKGSLLLNPESYQHFMDHLIYLTFTQLDLAYSMHGLSQFMHQPYQDHWDALFGLSVTLKVPLVKAYFPLQIEFTTPLILWFWSDQLPYHSFFFDRFLCFVTIRMPFIFF